MTFTTEEIKQATERLAKDFTDTKVNNNKSIGDYNKQREVRDIYYTKESMKRSHIINYIFRTVSFDSVAFVGSIFDDVDFIDCQIYGNSFISCNFDKIKVYCNDYTTYIGNNFSQSNFIECLIENITFQNSSFLKTLFQNNIIKNCRFEACTLEGSKFNSSILTNIDFGNVNVEFIEFLNTSLDNITLPFYQAAYIIGFADCIDNKEHIVLKAGDKTITKEEYKDQIDYLIPYYYQQSEYFPLCNLQIIKGDIIAAQRTLLNGINASVEKEDFRLIRYLCRLAQRYDLLDEFTTQRILRILENYVTDKDIPIAHVNNALAYYGEIRDMLLSGNSSSINLNIKIRTNVCKKNNDGVEYVNNLCNKLNENLSRYNLGQTGFQVAISNHSPFEIMVNVVCVVASIATISDFIWKIIDSVNDKTKSTFDLDQYEIVDTELLQQYTNTRIDLCKQELLNVKNNYSNKKMNQYIEDVTQQLKTDIDSFYEKDIIIYKKKNHKK